MDTFNVLAHLRIITPSDSGDGSFLILLDDSGEIPNFPLSNDLDLDFQIIDKLSNILYDNDLQTVFTTKTISYIEKNNDTLNIFYNFISTNTYSKTGSFVSFNKRSMQLHKLSISENS